MRILLRVNVDRRAVFRALDPVGGIIERRAHHVAEFFREHVLLINVVFIAPMRARLVNVTDLTLKQNDEEAVMNSPVRNDRTGVQVSDRRDASARLRLRIDVRTVRRNDGEAAGLVVFDRQNLKIFQGHIFIFVVHADVRIAVFVVINGVLKRREHPVFLERSDRLSRIARRFINRRVAKRPVSGPVRILIGFFHHLRLVFLWRSIVKERRRDPAERRHAVFVLHRDRIPNQ